MRRWMILAVAALVMSAVGVGRETELVLSARTGGLPPQGLPVLLKATFLGAVDLTIDHDDAGSPVDFGLVSPVGSPYRRDMSARVRSNSPWDLRLYKDQDLTNARGTARIPAGQLRVRVGDTGAFVPIRGTDLASAQIMRASERGSPTAVGMTIQYELIATWSDPTDRYRALHTYVLMHP